ncbi:MAG TPA: 2-amino-4-hydroxy-6-hydroxymethyldihydropteridine diphosphokinase, partial [Acidimicrobiia bacterium]
APLGGPDQDPFLNAVVVVETSLPPEEMLRRLHEIEQGRGRERTVRWGPRTLDLDIISSDGEPVDTGTLQIPHPRAPERRFVLAPLCDVWPEAMVAGSVTAEQALTSVAGQDVETLARRWLTTSGRAPGFYWVTAQGTLFLAIGLALVLGGSIPETVPDLSRGAGAVLLFLGILGVVISARSLGSHLSALPEPLAGGALVESGPYRLARHPIYGALVLLMLGASLLFASLPAGVLSAGLFGFFWAKSSYEERQLRIAYPGYAGYRRRVRKRMIPYVI